MNEPDLNQIEEPISGDARARGEELPEADGVLRNHVGNILEELVENPEREGLVETPRRVASSLQFLTEGYEKDAGEMIEGALFEIEYDEMVMVKNIDYYSLCEHHMLPFYGQAHIAYIPDRHVVGLSKLSRLVDLFAHRLQVQERLTTQVAETIQEHVAPKGVGVVIEGRHLCMMMRGVQKQNTKAVTSSMLDLFRRDSRTRSEFLELLRDDRSDV